MRQGQEAVPDSVRTGRMSSSAAESLIARVHETGGLTVDPDTGAAPAAGYCVNEVGDRRVPASAFFDPQTGRDAIEAFLAEYVDWFDGSAGKHVGFWHDQENEAVVMNRVDVVTGRKAAIELGRARNQRSVFDVAAGQEIELR